MLCPERVGNLGDGTSTILLADVDSQKTGSLGDSGKSVTYKSLNHTKRHYKHSKMF